MTTNLKPNIREAVERILKESQQPLNAREIASLAGAPLNLTRNHLSNAVASKKATNVGSQRFGRYVWGHTPVAEVVQYQSRMTGTYTGEKPLPLRPGSMNAYDLPSLVNGERTERKRPIINGAAPEVRA